MSGLSFEHCLRLARETQTRVNARLERFQRDKRPAEIIDVARLLAAFWRVRVKELEAKRTQLTTLREFRHNWNS